MHKKIFSLMIIGLVVFSMVGCINQTSNQITSTTNTRFVDTGDSYRFDAVVYHIYYDSVTNVVYMTNSATNRTGITVMYDSDGKPMTLSRYNQTK